ncbi:unnamed protein product, partial [Prorocentrum cordatum]
EEEKYSDLAPGQYVAKECEGDDVDHERILLYPLGGRVWWIRTLDGDEYFQDVACQDASDGPVRCRLLPADGSLPPGGRGRRRRQLCCFAERVGASELREGIQRGRRACEAECRPGQRPIVPERVQEPGGELMPIARFGGGSFPPVPGVRLRGKKPLTAALVGLPRPSEAVGGTATPVPEEEDEPAAAPLPLLSGHAWVLVEPTASSAIGSEVDIRKAPFVAASESAGLVLLERNHARVIRLQVGDVPAYADSRATELRRRLGTGHEDAEVDLRERIGRPPLPPPGGPPPAEEARSPIRSEDVRLLAVDFDGQGEHFKPWRGAVHESTQEDFSDQPALYMAGCYDQVNLGGLMALEELCKRLAGIVAARANPQRVQGEVAKCSTGAQSAEDVAGPVLLAGARDARGRLDMVSDALEALNWMAGGEADVQRGVRELADSWRPRPSQLSDEAALKTLLQGHPPHRAAGCPTRVAPFKLDLVSLPGSVRGCPLITDVAPSEVIGFLGGYHGRMLAPPVDKYETVPYSDPKLRFNQKEYHRLLRRLVDIGITSWTPTPKCQVGLFTVEKGGGAAQRLIVDARRANECFLAPPGVSLMSSVGLSRIETERPRARRWVPSAPPSCWATSTCRSGSRTSRTASTGYARRRGCLTISAPPAPARAMGATGVEVNWRPLGRAEAVAPRWAPLPMGFAWGLWIAQRINEVTVIKASPSLPGAPLHDRGPPLVVGPARAEEKTRLGHYACAGNLGVVGVCEQAVGEALEQLEEGFDREGLLLHKSELSRADIVALGAELDGAALRARVTPERFWSIHGALGALLRRRRAGARSLEVAFGHCAFAALCCRGLLSIFHSVYAFVERGRASGRVGPLRGECCAELRVFRSPMVFVMSDWLRGGALGFAGFNRQAGGSWSVAAAAEGDEDEPFSDVAPDWEVDRSFPEDFQLALRERPACSRQELCLPESEELLRREPELADVGESSRADDEERRRKFLDVALAAAAIGASSFLEESSVTPKVLGRCQAEVAGFADFAEGRPLARDEQVDGAPGDCSNFLLFKGWGANKGQHTLIGLMCLAPEFSRA